MKIEEFVEENIEEINHSIGSFKVQKEENTVI